MKYLELQVSDYKASEQSKEFTVALGCSKSGSTEGNVSSASIIIQHGVSIGYQDPLECKDLPSLFAYLEHDCTNRIGMPHHTEDGNSSSFRNVVFSGYLEFRTTNKVHNAVMQSTNH
jgi:hypothetical protein